jgi:very-short-patch-repair endonuclease
MIEYIVFFGLIAVCLVIFILFLCKPKTEGFIADPQRIKLESPIERRLYDCLKAQGEYLETQVPCGKYRIDMTLPTYRIAIECDGAAYHSSKAQKAHDSRKNKYLSEHGWKVLRFTGKRIHRDLRGIIKQIDKEKGSV